MKINFTFDSQEYDDKFKLACMLQAEEMYFALEEIKSAFRALFKYDQGLKDNAIDQAEYLSDEFFQILEDNKVDLDLAE